MRPSFIASRCEPLADKREKRDHSTQQEECRVKRETMVINKIQLLAVLAASMAEASFLPSYRSKTTKTSFASLDKGSDNVEAIGE